MATILQSFARYIGSKTWFSSALQESVGRQTGVPATSLIEGARDVGVDGALQLSAVWSCIDRRATTIASLPFFAYQEVGGKRELARQSKLYELLHTAPNSRMTSFEFWRSMVLNHDLRGNAYARIDRDSKGEAQSLWPMPADQVEPCVLDNGSMVYKYRIGSDVAILSDQNVLHLKNLGNGTIGMSKLEYMRSTTDEMAKAASNAATIFGSSGKPTGLLMIDAALKPEQREGLRASYKELATGGTNRLAVLEANMKYQQLSMSAEDQQLLETRHLGIEEICRWLDVPPVLVHHSNVTAWGSGIEQIIDGFHKFSIRPMLVNIEQAVTKRVMTPRQRVTMTVEFSFDALLRGNTKDRAEIAAKKVQNGLATRNEMRQLENEPPLPGGDVLTVQSNLLPIDLLGTAAARPGNGQDLAQ